MPSIDDGLLKINELMFDLEDRNIHLKIIVLRRIFLLRLLFTFYHFFSGYIALLVCHLQYIDSFAQISALYIEADRVFLLIY